jgi:hypothetical protein
LSGVRGLFTRELARRLLRCATQGQVARDLGEAHGFTRGVEQTADYDVRPEARAILAHAPALFLEPPFAPNRVEHSLGLAIRAVLGRVEEGEVLTDDLGRLVAFRLARALVPRRHMPGRVEHEDGVVGDRVDQMMKALLGAPQLLLRLPPLREIPRDLAEAAQLTLLVPQSGDHHVRPEQRAVLAHPPTLVLDATHLAGDRELLLRLSGCHGLGQVELGEVLADDLVRLVALDALSARVPRAYPTAHVEQEDRVIGDAVDEQLVVIGDDGRSPRR